MDETEIERRLTRQDHMLHAILAALAPPEEEGAGFNDLIETLSELTVAVSEVLEAVRVLRWDGSVRPPQGTSS